MDLNIDIGQGTCTMKYSPKVNDQLARSPKLTELHPLQDEATVQGILEVMYRLEGMLKEISGMDRVTLQPGAGSAAIYANVCMIRAYHAARGAGRTARRGDHHHLLAPVQRRRRQGGRLQGHHPLPRCRRLPRPGGAQGGRLRAHRGAADHQPGGHRHLQPAHRTSSSRVVHDAGGLCAYDQANANGILGITRAREAGFDLCHFNLHKTFSTPHGCGGPAAGACGVTGELAPFLPVPTVEFDGRQLLPGLRPPAEHRQGPPVLRRGAEPAQGLCLDHEPGRRRPARSGRDRRAQQQLPAQEGAARSAASAPPTPRASGASSRCATAGSS